MSEQIAPRQFTESDGVDDWRVVFGGATALFRTSSLSEGVALADAIARLSVDRPPDLDLRPTTLTVRFPDLEGVRDRDVELARQISAVAREQGLRADPAHVQTVQLALDALVPAEVLPFWAAVLGYDRFGDEDVIDPQRRGPSIWFQQMDRPRPQRNRFHVDVAVPHDQVEARVAAALAAGGHVVNDANAPQWYTLADSEGNEVDVAGWFGLAS